MDERIDSELAPTTDEGGDALVGSTDPLTRAMADGRPVGHWAVLGAGGVGVLALTVLRTLATPDARGYGTHEQLGLPPCMTMEVAGIPCPGCGVTTSVTLVTHGRIVEAFQTQPFGVLAAAAIPVFVAWSVWAHLRGVDLYASLTGQNVKRWMVPVVIALVVAWAYKLVVTFA